MEITLNCVLIKNYLQKLSVNLKIETKRKSKINEAKKKPEENKKANSTLKETETSEHTFIFVGFDFHRFTSHTK